MERFIAKGTIAEISETTTHFGFMSSDEFADYESYFYQCTVSNHYLYRTRRLKLMDNAGDHAPDTEIGIFGDFNNGIVRVGSD